MEKKLFAVPFALDQCQEITFGFLNIYSVKKLLSKTSLKHTDHNLYLLHNSEVIETFMVYFYLMTKNILLNCIIYTPRKWTVF